jgi:hypothetical protein
MKIKIQTIDNTIDAVEIVNAETGEQIEGITKLELNIEAGKVPTATLHVLDPYIDLVDIEAVVKGDK